MYVNNKGLHNSQLGFHPIQQNLSLIRTKITGMYGVKEGIFVCLIYCKSNLFHIYLLHKDRLVTKNFKMLSWFGETKLILRKSRLFRFKLIARGNDKIAICGRIVFWFMLSHLNANKFWVNFCRKSQFASDTLNLNYYIKISLWVDLWVEVFNKDLFHSHPLLFSYLKIDLNSQFLWDN